MALFNDPFRGGHCKVVLCESMAWTDGTFTALKPANSNFRHFLKEVEAAASNEEPELRLE